MRKSLLIAVLVICISGLIINLSKIVFGSFNPAVIGFITFSLLPYLMIATLSYWFNSLWITITTGLIILSIDIAQHLYVFIFPTDAQDAILLVITPIYFLMICVGSFIVLGLINKIISIIKTRKFFDKELNITTKKVFLFLVLPLTVIFILANLSYFLINYDFMAENPLHKAIRQQKTEEVKKLISDGKDIEALNYSKETPLDIATGNNSPEMIKILVKAGANINYLNPNTNYTPLMWGTYTNAKDSVKALLDAGADVNLKNNINGESAIIIAKDKDIIKMLIEYKANINDKDSFGQTALHKAVMYQNIETAKTLLNAGANIETKDQNGYTPLHEAARFGNIEIIKLLLDKDADKNAKTNDNNTPEELAKQNKFIETAELIKNYK